MNKVTTVAIFGGGNGAFIHAADLALKGFKVNICEAPELAKNLEGIMESKTIELTTKSTPGFDGGVAKLNMVTTDPAEALKDAQVAFVIVPAFAQRRFAEIMSDALRPDQVVVLEPGNFGGSLEFARVMLEKGKTELPILMEFQCMIYSGWKDSPTSVWASGFKKELKAAAFPASKTEEGLSIIRQIYPDIIAAKNVFETGLSNVNTPFHAPMLMCNAGWCEHTNGDFMLYWDGCTKSVGNLVQAVDDERVQVGKAFGMELEPSRDILIKWYGHQGAKGDTLQEVMSTNPAYEFDKCPSSLRHRYFLEDIPYGMIPLRDLARVAGIEVPNTAAIITIVSTLLNEDLEKKARSLEQLGLSGLDTQGIIEVLSEGFNAKEAVS
jgi:opine dehydrogenase